MGISARWLKSLVGLRKVERQQQQQKEDEDVGRMVRYLPINLQFWRILVLKLWLMNWCCLLPRPGVDCARIMFTKKGRTY